MEQRPFLMLQCAAFAIFGLALGLVPGPFLEGVYRMNDAGDVGWIRLFGATLLGIAIMEWVLLQDLEGNRRIAASYVAVPAALTVALVWLLIEGTEAMNSFFHISSLAITAFFTAGHLWLART